MADGGASDGLRTLRLDLEFDGAGFLGWQRQAAGRTVQAEIEAGLERVLGAPHRVMGAGRTDAGVHALGMVASTRTLSPMAPGALARALDAVLPEDVGVRDVREAAPTFHARRDALWKWYRYTLLLAPRRRPLLRRGSWHVGPRLDRRALEAAARVLEGRHDFGAFAGAGSPRRTAVRNLFAARTAEAEEEGEEDRLHLDLVGDGFLYKMARTIVGTLVREARARRGAAPPGPGAAAQAVRAVLEGRRRGAAGAVAPAQGLCLMAVVYPGERMPPAFPPHLARGVESELRGPTGERS